MKKVVSIFLCLLLILSTCLVASATGATAKLNSADSVDVGEDIEIVLNVSGCAEATSIAVEVSFDDAFALVSGTWLVSGALGNFDAAYLMGAIIPSSADVNGDLFKLVLRANKAAKAADVSIRFIANNGEDEVMDQVAQKSIAVKGEAEITFSKYENMEDNRTANYDDLSVTFTDGETTADGMWDISSSGSLKFGDANLDNYVFEADVYFGQVDGVEQTANNGYLEFRTHRGQSYYTQNRLLGSYKVVAATDTTPRMNVGTSFKDVNLQKLSKGVASYSQVYADGGQADSSFVGTDPNQPIHVRMEVLNGIVTFIATYDGVTKQYSVIGNKETDLAGKKGYFEVVLNSYTTGTTCKLDNVKVALLDTVKVNGMITGATMPELVVAPGTADNNTGLLYGENVEVDVFGTQMSVYVGDAITFEADDGYDVSKPGVRPGVTVKAGDINLGVHSVSYIDDKDMFFSTTFNEGDAQTGHYTLAGGAEIKDGRLYLPAGGRIEIGTTKTIFKDFVLQYTVNVPDQGEVVGDGFIEARLRDSDFARGSSYEFAFYADKASQDVSTWSKNVFRLYGRDASSAINETFKNRPAYGTDYKVKIVAVGSEIKISVYNADGSLFEENTYINTSFENGLVYIAAQNAFGYIDDVSVTPVFADQTPYAMTLSEDAALEFDPYTAKITATGTAVAKFYGFKPEGTVNLADVVGDMVYIGNNTICYGALELPCTLTNRDAGSSAIDFSSDELPTGWTTTDKFTTENGKYLLTNGSQSSLRYDLTFKDYIVEYDITPYLVQYITGSALSLVMPGPGSVKYEVAVFYDNYNSNTMKPEAYDETTFPAVGDTTSKKGGYVWRLFDRGATGTQLNAGGDIAPVGNSKVTTLSPDTNEAFAEKFAFEDSTSYRVRVEMIGNTIKVKIAVLGDEAIDWNNVPYVETLTRTDRVAAEGLIHFTANMDDVEALVDNVSITEVVEDVTIVGYEAPGQAVKVGTDASKITTEFKTVLSSGAKFDMPSNFIGNVTGYDANKLGKQTVILHYGDVEIEKTVFVVDYDVDFFEDFSGYGLSDTKPSTSSALVDGAKVNWNTNSGTIINGQFRPQQAWHLSNGSLAEGVFAADFIFSSDLFTSGGYADGLVKYGNSSSIAGFGIAFDVANLANAKLFISNNAADPLVTVPFEGFALDTVYRLEMRVYGNTLKGYVDGVECISYSATSADAIYTAITGSERMGFGVSLNSGALAKDLTGATSISSGYALKDNVIRGRNYAKYNVNSSAITALNTLPTKAQPGDKIYVSADINANGALKANDKAVYVNAATGYGGSGNDFMFVMPAQDVTLKISDNEAKANDIATIGTSVNEGVGLRFLTRLYLPAGETGLELGDITAFGAKLVPADLLGQTDIAEYTGKVYDAKAFTGDVEKTKLYDVTGKYADFAIVVQTTNVEREYVCVPYVVVNGQTIYGEAVTQSINGWYAQ